MEKETVEDGFETEGYSDSKNDSNADCNTVISDSNAQIEKNSVNDEIKQMYREVFDGEEEKKRWI